VQPYLPVGLVRAVAVLERQCLEQWWLGDAPAPAMKLSAIWSLHSRCSMRDVGDGEAGTGPQGKGGRGEGDGGEMTVHADCSRLSSSWFSGGGGGASRHGWRRGGMRGGH
jgi:hypothetical protein